MFVFLDFRSLGPVTLLRIMLSCIIQFLLTKRVAIFVGSSKGGRSEISSSLVLVNIPWGLDIVNSDWFALELDHR